MSTFQEMSVLFKKADSTLKPRLRSVLMKEAFKIRKDLVERSPVDTGEFVGNWQVYPNRYSTALSGITIKNELPYAYFMEYGADIGQAPWYYPNRNKKGQYKKGTGKLIVSKGRVWAGGLQPGHSKTIGGALGNALVNSQKRLNDLSSNLAEAVIVGFK